MKRLAPFERWIKTQRARLHNYFEQYDLQALVDVSLVGIIFIWFVWLLIFGN